MKENDYLICLSFALSTECPSPAATQAKTSGASAHATGQQHSQYQQQQSAQHQTDGQQQSSKVEAMPDNNPEEQLQEGRIHEQWRQSMSKLELQAILNKKFNPNDEKSDLHAHAVKVDEGLKKQWLDVVNMDAKNDSGIGPLDIKEVSWCAYMINDNKVKESETIIIGELEPGAEKQQSEDEKSNETIRVKSLSDAMTKFNNFICHEVIMKSYACKLIVEGNWVMDPYLKLQAGKN